MSEFKSGIVLFPESSGPDSITPAMARQFGMAVNTHTTDEGVELGTAHAVGYNPELIDELMEAHLRHLAGDLRRIGDEPPAERATDKERRILDEFNRVISAELYEADVAAKALSNVLYRRRVDIVIPESKYAETPYSLSLALPKIPNQYREKSRIHVWQQTETGVFVAQTSESVDAGHPLAKPGVHLLSHKLWLANSVIRPQVHEDVEYISSFTDDELAATGDGYMVRRNVQTTELLRIMYDIPAAPNDANFVKLQTLDLQHARALEDYTEAAMAKDADADGYLTDGLQSPHAPYYDRTESDRRKLGRLIDPINSPEWRSRLN